MFNRIFALVVVLVVPVITLAIGHKIESEYEAEWRQIAQTRPPTATANLMTGTLAQFCTDTAAEDRVRVCGWYKNVTHMKTGAILALLLGAVLLGSIYILARGVKHDRQRLMYAFVPGLYGVFLGLIILTALHGVLITASLVLGVTAALGRPSVYETFAAIGVLVMTLVAVIILIRGMLLTVTKVKIDVVGKRLTADGSPQLWNHINAIAEKLGALAPDNLIVGLEPTFFVTEADVRRAGGYFRGRTLYLSLPLCRILSAAELCAVIGHELGHFRGADTAFSQKFYPIYRGVKSSLYILEGSQRGGAQGLVLLPAVAILNLYMEAFERAEAEIGRERELIADQAGAEASSSEALASSLVKLHAFGHYYESTRDRMRESLVAGKTVDNLSVMYGDYIKAEAAPTHFIGLDDEKLAHPTDTHPPLGIRLEALGHSLAAIETAALNVLPLSKAVELIDNYETTEKELTGLETRYMVKTGEVPARAGKTCAGCGRMVPLNVDTCDCGINFRRVGLS